MDRKHIDKITSNTDDQMLLAKIWDKINNGIARNIPANTCFLTPRELEMSRYLFGQLPGLCSFGGFEEAERRMLVYLPEYLDETYLSGPDSPIVCLRSSFYQQDSLTHRDFLGALMGAGIARESVGDICVDNGSCDFFVTTEIAPYILQNLTAAGRTHLSLTQISMSDVRVPAPSAKEIRDTLASLRLDSVLSAGFRISRSIAAQHIAAGRASINGLPCEKPDKTVQEGDKFSVRGLGKIKLKSVNGQTKKGRISVIIDRYM